MSAETYQAPFRPVSLGYEFREPEQFERDQLHDWSPESIRKLLGGGRRMIAAAMLRHLQWAFTRSKGGLLDADGEWWVYKCARAFRDQVLQSAMGFCADLVAHSKSFQRTARALAQMQVVVRREVVIRNEVGGGRQYAYQPGPNWEAATQHLQLSHPPDNPTAPPDTAVPHAETSQKGTQGRGRKSDSEQCYNPGARPAEIPDWAREHAHQINSPATPQPLDSRPDHSPVEPDADHATEKGSEAALNAFNAAQRRLWAWDSVTERFRHPQRSALTVEDAAREWGVCPAALRVVVG